MRAPKGWFSWFEPKVTLGTIVSLAIFVGSVFISYYSFREQVSSSIATLTAQVSGLSSKITELSSSFTGRIESVDNRSTRLEDRIVFVERRLRHIPETP